MRSICLCFQVHQPYRLRTYRFFNLGHDHQYYDDYQNRHILRRIAAKSYIPANRLMLDLIREYGSAFKVSYTISGLALDQLNQYAPEVIDSFRELAATGSVEFIGDTYSNTLASLAGKEEFVRQVEKHREKIRELFWQVPVTFQNTEMIYSDQIGQDVAEMGFTTMLTEGAKHVLGWKSPNFLYVNAANPKLKLLLRNPRLSDDIIFKFSNKAWSEWPLTAEKYVGWLNNVDPAEEVVNIFMNYETIGEQQNSDTGIFDFFRSLPATVFSQSDFKFATPSEINRELQPVAPISVRYPISWADEEKDITAWLGNELQDEAFRKVFSISENVRKTGRRDIMRDWERLQTSDHFYYMCTKWFSDGEVHQYFNPYPSPYEAFINYMNVLSDLMIRVDEALAAGPVLHEPEPAELPKVKKTTVKAGPKEKKVTPAKKTAAATVKGKAKKPEAKVTFEDIATMQDKQVKSVIKDIDPEILFIAMKGAGKELHKKIEKNLSKKTLKLFEGLSGSLGKIRKADVERHRDFIEEQLNRID